MAVDHERVVRELLTSIGSEILKMQHNFDDQMDRIEARLEAIEVRRARKLEAMSAAILHTGDQPADEGERQYQEPAP